MKDNKYDKLDNKKRKIEFRWWNKLYNKMFYSYKELYDFIEDMEENNEELFDKDEGFWKDEIYTYNYALNLDFDIEENSNCVPMQFTGLCDKDGKKIYEGDIVKSYYGSIYIVKYFADWGSFSLKLVFLNTEGKLSRATGRQHLYKNDCTRLEILGNVWDNPELLGGSDEECDN